MPLAGLEFIVSAVEKKQTIFSAGNAKK